MKPMILIIHMHWRKVWIRKSKIMKSGTDQKVIRRRFVCNKEGQKIRDKRQEDQEKGKRVTRYLCECPARIEVVLNDMSEC